MVHGDDDGLVLPPRIAPTQVMIIPIAQQKEGVLDKAKEILDKLQKLNIRAKIDDSEKSPGFKYSEQEILGIPLRIEIGPKDIEKNELVIVRRNDRKKITLKINEIENEIQNILEEMQNDMYNNAKNFLDNHIYTAKDMDEMKEISKNKIGFIKAMWCGDENCEDKIKTETEGFGSRCIPEEQEHLSDTCVCCGKKAKHMVVWGKSY